MSEEAIEAAVEVSEPAIEVRYAGFWIRFAAVVIDSVLMILLIAPLLLAVFGFEYFTMPETRPEFSVMDIGLNHLLPMVLTIVLWLKFAGTPGKLLLGLAVVDRNTFGKISVAQAIFRYLGYIVSTIGLLLGFIWAAFDEKKRTWHDLMANTVVIRR